jgi:hypothetical protein
MSVIDYSIMGIKNKIQATKSSLTSKASDIKKDTKFAKEILSTKGHIFLKTDSLAILVRKKGDSRTFFEVLSKITAEGYDLKSQEPLADLLPLAPNLATIYILQNKKYVNV